MIKVETILIVGIAAGAAYYAGRNYERQLVRTRLLTQRVHSVDDVPGMSPSQREMLQAFMESGVEIFVERVHNLAVVLRKTASSQLGSALERLFVVPVAGEPYPTPQLPQQSPPVPGPNNGEVNG